MNPGMRAVNDMGYGYPPDPMHMRDEAYQAREMDPRFMRDPRMG